MAIILLDSENADLNLTSQITVLTHTPSASAAVLCQAVVYLGDGTKNLDGTGGTFEVTITLGSQTVEPDPQEITVSAGQTRAAFASQAFTVPPNQAVVIKVKSPNAADSDVDVTAYLYDVWALTTSSGNVALAADAITSAVYDESTAFPLKSADTGSTQVARTGADSDTLETLSDQLDSTSTLTAAQVNTEVDTALTDIDLDHLVQVSAGSEEPTDGTYLDQIMHKDSSQTFSSTTDSLEALGDKISTGAFAVTSVVDGDDVTVYRGTQWSITFSDLGSVANYSKLWFTAKDDLNDPDTQAVVQVIKHSSGSGDGLVYINGMSAPSSWSSKAYITITSLTDGDGTITVDESATMHISPRKDKHYDIKVLRTTGAVDSLADGEESFTVKGDATRAIS